MRLLHRRPSLALWISSSATGTANALVTRAAFLPSANTLHQRCHYFHRSAFFSCTSIAANTRKSRRIVCSGGGDSSSIHHSSKRHVSSDTSTMNKVAEEDVSTLRVALCQFKVTDDKDENHGTCQDFMKRASEKGAQLVVLPEIWSSPYATAAFPDYAEELPSVGEGGDKGGFSSSSAEVLRKAAVEYKFWIVGGSIAERDASDGKIYNTCLTFDPRGMIVAKHRKVHLFDIDIPGGITFFESETLSAGGSVTDFDTPWCKVGVGICYDIRFAAYAMLLQQRGCKILIYPGAFNMTTGPAHWELLQRARAIDNQCFVLTASPARASVEEDKVEDSGGSSGTTTTKKEYPPYTAWGHSTAISPWGDVIATTDEKEDIVVVDLDLTSVDKIRQSIPIMKQKRLDLYRVDAVA